MLKSPWIVMSLFFSFSALAEVSFIEKKNRVDYLEELTKDAVSMDVEAYRRELEYEKQDLSLEKRAQNEANLIAEQVKLHVQKAYASALETKSAEEAYEEVKATIEKDLMLVDAELHDELKEVAMNALDQAQTGGSSSIENLSGLEKAMLKNVQERVQFLNEEGEDMNVAAPMMDNYPSSNKSRDAEKKSYKNKAEILESLVSDRENTRWVSTSNMSIRSDDVRRAESRINLRVKVDFLGVAIDAGPSIMFGRTYRTHVAVIADGLNPVLGNDGNFDFLKRDRMNRPIKEGGKNVRRFIAFTCEAALDFETEYSGSGGFSIAGSGASASVSRKFANSVTLSSRRIAVPEAIGGMSVTYKYLNQLCHLDFLRTRITNNMNVAGSLNAMMRNVVSSLRFSHPQTRCMQDKHCYNWFNKTAFTVSKKNIFPRCREHKTEKYRSCYVLGLPGQNCAVYENGKRTSSGQFEYTCDAGLKCVKYQDAGWMRPSKGKCMPINPRTYKNPYTQVRARSNVIYVDLVRG